MGNLENQRGGIYNGDLAFLQRTRADTVALLDNLICWTELMRSMTSSIPRENGKFGQDALGGGLFQGVSTAEVDAILADESAAERLRTLLRNIDGQLLHLMQEQSDAGETAVRQRAPAA